MHSSVQVEKTLIDDVLMGRPLVLENDGRAALIQAQGVDPATVDFSCGVLGARNLTSKVISMFSSMRVWRFRSRAKLRDVSFEARLPSMRNSFRPVTTQLFHPNVLAEYT
jgi:hypothetical protein